MRLRRLTSTNMREDWEAAPRTSEGSARLGLYRRLTTPPQKEKSDRSFDHGFRLPPVNDGLLSTPSGPLDVAAQSHAF